MKRTIALALLAAGLFAVSSGAPAQAQKRARTPKINARQENQQDRIQQGIKSDELTKKEAARLEAQAGRIQAQKLVYKSEGKVTPAEKAKLERELNKESHQIYKLKHNEKEAK